MRTPTVLWNLVLVFLLGGCDDSPKKTTTNDVQTDGTSTSKDTTPNDTNVDELGDTPSDLTAPSDLADGTQVDGTPSDTTSPPDGSPDFFEPQPVCAVGTSSGPVLAPQFVMNLSGQTSWFASPLVVDLDNDGQNELIAAPWRPMETDECTLRTWSPTSMATR